MRSIAFCLVIVLAGAITAPAADWPQFLGPARDGIASPAEPAMPAKGAWSLSTLWTHEVGSGFAGPVVVQGRVIVFHRVGNEAVVEALDAHDGGRLWRFAVPNDYQDSFGMDDGPRACPTVADGRVFVHGAEGMVHALDFSTGRLLWSYDTVKETGSPQGFFGRACAPLVVGDKVIVTPGGRTSEGPAAVIALKAADGSLVWQALEDEAGYASPMLHEGTVFSWLRNHFAALQPETGKVIFQKPLRSSMDASVNAAQPVWCGRDLVFTSAGYGVGAHLWKWDKASGMLSEVWHKEDVLECHYSTPVFQDGFLYGFHGRQEFGQSLRCIRVRDGAVMWESSRVPGGTLLLVHGTLVALTEAGEVWVVEASPEEFHSLLQEQLLRGGHRSYAAYADGVIYARDGRQLVAARLAVK